MGNNSQPRPEKSRVDNATGPGGKMNWVKKAPNKNWDLQLSYMASPNQLARRALLSLSSSLASSAALPLVNPTSQGKGAHNAESKSKSWYTVMAERVKG